MQIPAFSIFCELWIHGSRIALLCLESCRAFSSWHSRCFNPALDEFWRCSGETLDAAPPQDEWRNIAAEHIKDKFNLHVDGATADNVKPDGVEIRKDSVDHRCRNGEPYFVKSSLQASPWSASGQPKKSLRSIQAKNEPCQHDPQCDASKAWNKKRGHNSRPAQAEAWNKPLFA